MSTYLPTLFGDSFLDALDDFDRDFWGNVSRPERVLYGKNASHIMKTDVKEYEDHYEVCVDLPGFAKENIHLELNQGNLTISAEKHLEKENQDKMLRQERFVGTMQRSFYVGEGITEGDIRAKYENGVLCLSIPKMDKKKVPEKRQILIEG